MKRAEKLAYERYLRQLRLAASAGQVDPYETPEQKRARIERAKKDSAFMVRYYFPHFASAESAGFQIHFAKKVKRNKLFKGFAQWGRGLAKSVWNDVFIPFWLWINGEPVYLVIIGDSETKAKQLLGDIMAEFEANPRIKNDFGEQKNLGSWEDGFFVTKGGFIGQALGTGQNVRGLRIQSKRPTHIVVDDIETRDINKNPKRQREITEWIERALIPTMDGPIRRFVYAHNKYAPQMIQTMLQERHPDWYVHNVNAYDPVTYQPAWPEKYDRDYYRQLEKEIGRLAAMAEYNNEPHKEGAIFKWEMIQWAPLPRLTSFDMIAGRWDVAYAGTANSDYNAVRVWGLKDGRFYYIDGYVRQSKMIDAVRWIADFQRRLPKNVIVHWGYEAQFWNDELERTIRQVEREIGIPLSMTKIQRPRVSKYNRILSLHPYYQNGRIYYNEKLKSNVDCQTGIAQLLGIEPGYKGHDDAPDADEMAISYLSKFYYGAGSGDYDILFQPITRKRRF